MAIYRKGADPDALDAAAGRLRQHASDLDVAADTVRSALENLLHLWSGDDLDAFQEAARLRMLPALAGVTGQLESLSEALTRNAARQRGASVASTSVFAPTPTTPDGSSADDDRGSVDRRNRSPDGRDGRRVANDDRSRGHGRNDPRDSPPEGSSLSNDWAGRSILERYLTGGGDWTIHNDPTWTGYLESNESMRSELARHSDGQAQVAVRRYLETGDTTGSYDERGPMQIENGEGIVGYEYLHGTNADVGGFREKGTTTVTPLPDGGYRVTMNNDYQWNDVIDPNPEYSTDRWKSRLAEILTLGQADPYDIHIGWNSTTTTITYDADGTIVSQKGYPG